MPKSKSSKSKSRKKRILALPNLEQAKAAVLYSLTSASGQRTYDHAIREFVAWLVGPFRASNVPLCGPTRLP
jgi:ribosomal protein L32